RRRHTRSKRDWSSDVCSSDLSVPGPGYVLAAGASDRASWRLEAGLTWLGSTTNQPPIGATLVRTNVGSEVSRSVPASSSNAYARSEERRVGKEGRCQRVRRRG